MEESIIGRKQEKQTLGLLLDSGEPEFLAIYGRRRVGKTFLVKEYFENRCPLFELTGENGATLPEQLQNFCFAFHQTFPDEPTPRVDSWREAFHILADTIDRVFDNRRVILFFDELPWLAGRKSKFLSALDHLWNSWGNRRNLLLIVCGSATSWMITKVMHNKGGLYNRVTAQIELRPFSLAEVETYLRHRGIHLVRKDILELYLCLGGIPHYLRGLRRGESVAQAIDRLCFSENGLLHNELEQLFASLFSGHKRHVAVIRALAEHRKGITRNELLRTLGEDTGGGLSRILKELERSAFISREPCFGHAKRNAIYRLIDEYCLFYLKWIEPMSGTGEGYWIRCRGNRGWQTWAALAFESVCMKHIARIKQTLGIAGVSTLHSAWRGEAGGEATQIDLVIDRADNCINLCEMKFSRGEFRITKSYAADLARKLRVFRDATQTRKNLFLTMVTTFGCVCNRYYEELVDSDMKMDVLFGP